MRSASGKPARDSVRRPLISHLPYAKAAAAALALFVINAAAQVSAAQTAQAGADDPAATDTIEETAVVASDPTSGKSWVDSSHEYATSRAQDLVQWMDDFFGAPVRDAERADSFVRAIVLDDWDERDGHDFNLRVRGQISLPKVSERVDIIFSGEEAEQTLTEDQRAEENDIGARLNLRDSDRSRLDATLSLRSGPAILPGVRYRYQQPLSENSWGRVTQRLQYHSEDGYRSLTNFDLNRILDDNSLLRWGARLRYEEDKEFWDWNTGVTYRRWLDDHDQFPSAIEYFASLSGRDKPSSFNTSYRLGFLYRKQFFRRFLYYEVEPSVNWRRDTFEEKREAVLGIVLRLEIMLDEDLVRKK